MEDEKPVENEPQERKRRDPSLFRNLISLIGIAIIVAALTSILLLILLEFSGGHDNPYAVLVTYILLPSVMAFGIAVAIVGAILERRRRRRSPDTTLAAYPVLDLNDPSRRRTLLVFVAGSFFFLFLTAFGSYRAFEYTESVSFCGEQCHTVMNPEFVAFKAAPHANIRCVDCHVGGGSEWYVRSKLNGMRQLYSMAFNSFNRPIETPVHNMRKANETCAACHRPDQFHGEVLKTIDHFGFDEANSLRRIRMLINVGGGDPTTGQAKGIHWHMNLNNEITYSYADEKRQVIPWIRVKNSNGEVTEYFATNQGMDEQTAAGLSQRRMDCIDCHNRPTHQYLSPNKAVDKSMSANLIDPSIPFIKARSVETLSKDYATKDEAVASIRNDLDGFYKANYGDFYNSRRATVDAAISEVQRIYQTYFFPEMRTNWSSHIDNIGHFNAVGCFRCHDGQHKSNTGKVIRNDCAICHTTLDQSMAGTVTVPSDGRFQHPVNLGDRNTFQCAACHLGDRSFKHPIDLGDLSRYQCADCHKGEQYKTLTLRK